VLLTIQAPLPVLQNGWQQSSDPNGDPALHCSADRMIFLKFLTSSFYFNTKWLWPSSSQAIKN